MVIVLGTLSLLAMGCTHTLCFRAVDAATKEPLAGVTTEWRQDRDAMFAKSLSSGPSNLPPSGDDGVIKIAGLHKNWSTRFTLKCTGYSNVYGDYSGMYGLGLSGRITDFDDEYKGQFILEGKLTGGVLTNGCFLIPMQKLEGNH